MRVVIITVNESIMFHVEHYTTHQLCRMGALVQVLYIDKYNISCSDIFFGDIYNIECEEGIFLREEY